MAELVAPVVPVGENLADPLLKGFALMAQISARRRQSELALEKIKNQVELGEMKHQVDLERLEQQGQHNADVADHYRLDADNAERRIKLRDEEDAFRQGRTKEQLEGGRNLLSTINAIDKPKHTQEWRDAVSDALLDNPDAAGTPQYKQFQEVLKREKSPTFRSQQITLDSRLQGLGIPKNYLYGALENPDHFTQTDKDTPDSIFAYGGKRLTPKMEDNKAVMDSTGKPVMEEQSVWVPIKKNTWTTLKKTYDDMYGSPDSGRTPPDMPKKQLDPDIAGKILTEIKAAHPDWTPDRVNTEARLTAQRNGYE